MITARKTIVVVGLAAFMMLGMVWISGAAVAVAQQDTTKAPPPAPKPPDSSAKGSTPGAATSTPGSSTSAAGAPATDTAGKAVTSAPAGAGAKSSDTTKATSKSTDTTKAKTGAAAAGAKSETKPKPETAPVDPKAPYKSVTFAKGEKPRIVMETSAGKIVLELWPDAAPKHCQSFVYLVNKHFFDSLTFHRVVPGFVIQGGDPKGNGTGGPGYTIPAEFSDTLKHDDGILSMARATDPNSAGSQFFICLSREQTKGLDRQYTIFGKVVEGLDVVHKIEKMPAQGERPTTPVYMTKVYVEKKG